MRLRFTIRDLLWLTALVALGVAWWLDRRHAKESYAALEKSAAVVHLRVLEAALETKRHELTKMEKVLEANGLSRPNGPNGGAGR